MDNPIIENILKAGWEAELNKLSTVFTGLIAQVEKINIGLGKGGGTTSDAGYKQLSTSIQQVSIESKKAAIVEEQLAQAKLRTQQIQQKTIGLTVQEKVEKESLTRITKLEAQATNENIDAVTRMNAQQKLAVINYANVAQKVGVTAAELSTARGEVVKTTDALVKLNTGTVGMKKGMNNAYNSTFQMTQVMRELPNFAIDARIGFMSLSNNLPMLADGFKQLAATQIQVTDAMGNITTKTAGMGYAWKTMLKSILSVNTVMILGVTLLTLYGDKIVDWVSSLFKAEKATKDLMNIQGQLHSVQKKGIEDAQTEKTKLEALYSASQDNKRSMDERKLAVDELQKKYPKYFGNLEDEEILLGNGRVAYDNLTEALYRNAVARATLDRITENAKQILTIKEQIAWRKRFIELNKQDYDTNGLLAQAGSARQKAQIKQSGEYYRVLGEKLDTYGKDIVRLEKQEQAVIRVNDSLKSSIDVSGIIDQNNKAGEDSAKVSDEEAKSIENVTKRYEEWLEVLEKGATTNEDAAKQYETTRKALALFLYEQTGDKEQYDAQVLDSEQQLAINIEKIRLGSQDKIASDHQDYLDGMNDALKTANDEYLDELIRSYEIEKDVVKQNADNKREIEQETFDFLKELFDSLDELYQDSLDNQQDALEREEDAKLETVEGNESETAAVKAYYQSQYDEIEAQRRESERKSALATQAAAIAEIWIQAAKAIMSYNAAAAIGLATLNPFLVTAAETGITQTYVLAAIQSATAAAQTIPYFAEGGKILGEGRISDAPNIPQRANGDNILAYVKHGETILNNDQINALGGAYAMKQAGVPGYEDARYIPDMRDIGTHFSGKDKQPIIVNANFESEKIVRELQDIKSALSSKHRLMDTLKSKRYGN